MEWFMFIMFSIYFTIEVLIPIALILAAPFIFYYIGIFFINIYYWFKYNWRRRR